MSAVTTQSASQKVAANVRNLRIQRGLSQAKVAQHLKLDPSAVTRLELSARPFTIDELVALANLFDVPAHVLLEESPRYVRCAECDGTGYVKAGDVQ